MSESECLSYIRSKVTKLNGIGLNVKQSSDVQSIMFAAKFMTHFKAAKVMNEWTKRQVRKISGISLNTSEGHT